MSGVTNRAIDWTEQGLVPDAVIRHGIRRLLRRRLTEVGAGDCEHTVAATRGFVAAMDASPIALVPELANEQHYEVPADFFSHVLGPNRKYSGCHWPDGVNTLADAEHIALQMTCRRAKLEDGMRVLELGCGWGSLSLYMAHHFPHSSVVAVSNSQSQADFMRHSARVRGLDNLEVITCDMNDFDDTRRFDRVVSVEMFEHMRNYRVLFEHISRWLEPDGHFFMHIFCHRAVPYEFTDNGPGDWMSRHFFSGGIMPSDDLPLHFQDRLKISDRWRWDGTHYEKTANTWLENMDENRDVIMPILAATYGEASAQQWFMRWRIFFMSCAELFGFRDGQEWWVGHYLFDNARVS